MKLGIMQPYLFPYIGYFQLVHATDMFVFYDDVNFINRGWINRNRILLNGKDQLFTMPCKDASQNRLIKDIEVADDAKNLQKILPTIKTAYKKAPYFTEVYPIVEAVLMAEQGSTIAGMAIASIMKTCDYLGLQKQYKTSSLEYDNRELKKADRLIDICHIEGIKEYINPVGGKEIYTKEYFGSKGVHLDFLISEKTEYSQFTKEFVPWLSIIDVLMFNDKEEIVNKILPAYNLE